MELNHKKLICCVELNVWIAAETEWKFQNPECSNKMIEIGNIIDNQGSIFGWHKNPQPLHQFSIEMTLKRKCIPRIQAMGYSLGEHFITQEAFKPKTFNVKLEKGNFSTSHGQYGLRLVFDPSPYPPRSEWKDAYGPDAMKMWEWKNFVGRKLPEPATRSGKCIIS